MAPHADIGYLVGYKSKNGHIYKIYFPESCQIKPTQDVIFNENHTYRDDKGTGPVVQPIHPTNPSNGPTKGVAAMEVPENHPITRSQMNTVPMDCSMTRSQTNAVSIAPPPTPVPIATTTESPITSQV